jgi:hypothetical protein
MPLVDVMDDTFVAAAPADVAARLADPATWPGLRLTVVEDRGIEGIRWQVHGRLVGTAEVWIEPYDDKGCIVHFFLRGNPARPWRYRRNARARRRSRHQIVDWKRRIHAVKDSLEAGRRT